MTRGEMQGDTHRDQIELRPDRWRLVTRRPAAWLRPHVIAYADYTERITDVLLRRQLPTTQITLIIILGDAFLVEDATGDRLPVRSGGFLAGMHTAPALTIAHGIQRGMEVRLSPLGAHRLLGQPMHLLANRALDLTAVLGPQSAVLVEQLHGLHQPAERLSLLEQTISHRIAAGGASSAEVSWAWRQLAQPGGRTEIALLADELGWSKKRLIARFREEIGVPPKTAAQILRFERTVALLPGPGLGPGSVDWAELAQRGGYYDQSHLAREVRRFAGRTPGELLQERIATELGSAAG